MSYLVFVIFIEIIVKLVLNFVFILIIKFYKIISNKKEEKK